METHLVLPAVRPAVSLHSLTLLTVDDSRLLHTIVARYLEGTEIIPLGHAMDGGEALEMAQAERPDLILLDLIMPGVSGPEALAAILGANPEARVIMASSIETEDAARDCLRAGAMAFLTKPFSRGDLLACLRRVAAGVASR